MHCAIGSPLCAANSQPDELPSEPGGYNNFKALFGNKHVQPQMSPGGPVLDLDGNPVADSTGNIGFPGFDPTASQTLGYLAEMLEAGLPVVYGYIEDAHDDHVNGVAFGPARPAMSLSSNPSTTRSASSSRASPRTASLRKTRCSSSPPMKTTISPAARRRRQIATA